MDLRVLQHSKIKKMKWILQEIEKEQPVNLEENQEKMILEIKRRNISRKRMIASNAGRRWRQRTDHQLYNMVATDSFFERRIGARASLE